MQRVRELLDRTLIIWLVGSSGLALMWGRHTTEAEAWFQFWNRWTMFPMIVSAMFAIGFLLPKKELTEVIRQGWAVLLGTCTQYLSMPLLAFLIATALRLEGPLFTGMILTGAVPGAMASNVLTLTARGNVSYSICLTTVATLVSPVTVPLALWLFLGVNEGPNPLSVFLNLMQTVALPVLCGFGFQCLLGKRAARFSNFAGVLANLAILWIIAVAIGLNAHRLMQVTPLLLLALLGLNLCGYLAGWCAGQGMRLDRARRRALVLEIGMQNAGVGTILALSLFPDPATAIPTATYTFGCMFTGTILATGWNWMSAGEQIPVSQQP